jgi:tRNA wybutosine-synthesizing protein 1
MVKDSRTGAVTVAIASSLALFGIAYCYVTIQNKVRQITEQDNQISTKTKKKKNESRTVQVPVIEVGGTNTTLLMDDTMNADGSRKRILTKNCITIVHGSMTGTCTKFATTLYDTLIANQTISSNRIIQIGSIEDFDWWDELLNDDDSDNFNVTINSKNEFLPVLIVLLSTNSGGTWPESATGLYNSIQDLQNDWRVEKFPLKNKLQGAVFGMGSSEYDDNSALTKTAASTMGKPAKDATRSFQKLGIKNLVKVRIGDDSIGTHAETTYNTWKNDLLNVLLSSRRQNGLKEIVNWQETSDEQKETSVTACCNETKNSHDCCKSNNDTTTDQHCCDKKETVSNVDNGLHNGSQEVNMESDDDDEYESDDDDDEEPEVIDLEDMGDAVMASTTTGNNGNTEPREMVTPSQAKALQKEGYKLIGTHSAVKLCRWTKHQLRGRGGCYKHTFYGITSYQCMEATPSLACANKCVFCWRHHKNPVGKEWKWKTDDPLFIVEQAVSKHLQMIKEARGIPGVQIDRWKEAHTVKHCALSLVGEPIMYPRIDELLSELHRRNISSFLVTNGQHPAAIGSLRPVTQLYVSVDAPTEESLIAIDRPLFSDAWDRLKESLTSLREKGQRTVARLTVVKGWNSDEVEGYAKLIALGKVSLVEIKGVTFCGKSDASNLNMSNTPWHHEVIALTQTVKKKIDELRQIGIANGTRDIPPEYDIACEHRHSCSVLLARVDQFAVDDPITNKRIWKTWINYEKFQELAERNAADPAFTFTVEDYTAVTPSWALFGSEEEGFDPTDNRHRRKTKFPMYTRFDHRGVPTHDDNGKELHVDEYKRLSILMDDKLREVGAGSTVTELKGGAREIMDASLMFRGLIVAK